MSTSIAEWERLANDQHALVRLPDQDRFCIKKLPIGASLSATYSYPHFPNSDVYETYTKNG